MPVEVTEAPIDLPAVTPVPQECHSEILIEVGKAKLRIIGTPGPQTLQFTLQRLLQ